MQLNTPQKICLTFLALLFVFWIMLFIHGTKTSFYNYLYSFLIGLMPFFGGIAGVRRAPFWGGWKTDFGKSIILIGLSMLCWGIAETIWSYYNFFLNIPAPYPSLTDVFFVPSTFLYGLGTIYLAKATGVTLELRKLSAKVFAILALLSTLLISYYVLIVTTRRGILITNDETAFKILFDVGYPLGDFVSLATAILISGLAFRYLKGQYKHNVIATLFGLATMFIADSVFAYTTITDTFYNGNFGDLIYTLGLFLITFSLLGFYNFHKADVTFPEIEMEGNRIVFTSEAENCSVVIENQKLAEALRKAFGNPLRWLTSKVNTY